MMALTVPMPLTNITKCCMCSPCLEWQTWHHLNLLSRGCCYHCLHFNGLAGLAYVSSGEWGT